MVLHASSHLWRRSGTLTITAFPDELYIAAQGMRCATTAESEAESDLMHRARPARISLGVAQPRGPLREGAGADPTGFFHRPDPPEWAHAWTAPMYRRRWSICCVISFCLGEARRRPKRFSPRSCVAVPVL
jgi:hypothetical protein